MSTLKFAQEQSKIGGPKIPLLDMSQTTRQSETAVSQSEIEKRPTIKLRRQETQLQTERKQIEEVQDPSETQKFKMGLLIKNQVSSRKLITFDKRCRDVILFNRINDKYILAKLKGEERSYWSLMDTFGNI